LSTPKHSFREVLILVLMHTTLNFFMRIRENATHLSYPISYPNSDEEYYGYVSQVDDANRAATKELINCIGKPALALVTYKMRRGFYARFT
jgi:hypothetical protein